MLQWRNPAACTFMLHSANGTIRRLAALVAIATLVLASSQPPSASAHESNCNSVGVYPLITPARQMHWGSSTKYVEARDYGIAAWNAFGRVPIVPDRSDTALDVEFRDTYRDDVKWVGRHFCILTAAVVDTITFNSYFMDVYSSAMQKHVAMHELGHALEFDDIYDTMLAESVMYHEASSGITFAKHDIDDYTAKWGAIPTPALSITDAQVTERDSGTVNATFTVRLSAVPRDPVTVRFQTVNGTASSGSDFVAASGPLFFPRGTPTLSKTITVQVRGDTADEEDESFFVDLIDAVGAPVSDGRGIGTIRDNDGAPSEPIPGDPDYCALHPKDPACTPFQP